MPDMLPASYPQWLPYPLGLPPAPHTRPQALLEARAASSRRQPQHLAPLLCVNEREVMSRGNLQSSQVSTQLLSFDV